MNQRIEKSKEVYTPKHINELKLYNSISMKESSEMVREMPPPYHFTDSYYFEYYDFTLKEHKEKEIIFDMPFGNDQDLPIINELNLNFAIENYFSSTKEYEIIKDQERKKKIKGRLDFLIHVIENIIDWFIENNYPIPNSSKEYLKVSKQSKIIPKKTTRPKDPEAAKEKKRLNVKYLELKDTKGLDKDTCLDILEKEFPDWTRSTIETYIKK